jgi:hypothetical protein
MRREEKDVHCGFLGSRSGFLREGDQHSCGFRSGDRSAATVPLENLEMSERREGNYFPLQFMGNVIPQPDHEGKTVGGTGRSMLVKTIRMMQACQRSRDQTQIAKGQSER